MHDISTDEILEQLRLAIAGVARVCPVDGSSSISKNPDGEVEYWVGGWRITFALYDGNALYLEELTTHDGRHIGVHEFGDTDPLDRLSKDERAALVMLL